MKADWRDAPDYFQARRKKQGIASLIPWLIGTVTALGILHIFSSLLLGNVTENLSSKKLTPKPEPIAEIYRPQLETKKATDWDQVVYKQAQRDATPQTKAPQETTTPTRQTVFNDRNYTPQGAINIVQAEQFQARDNTAKPQQKTKIIVIGKPEPRLSDYCPYKKGSIEHRNCKASTNLRSR